MSKPFVFFFLLLLFPLSIFAQVDILQAPSDAEKKEVLRILGEYQNFLKSQGDSALPKEKKAGSTLKFVKELYNINVEVYYDLDSVASGEDKFMKILSYAQQFREKYPQTVVPTLEGVVLSKVKYDKFRRYYFIEATANKKLAWNRISSKIIKDSVNMKDSLVADTVEQSFTRKLTFYIRFDRVNDVSKNFKLMTVSRTGGQPKLEPLPAVAVWWMEMDPQWKAYFREKYKLEEYPATHEIERITSLMELDISNKPFKTLEPVRKMVFLQKLNCSNTPIQSLEPLSGATGLLELDISNTKVNGLEGIEKLANLQKLDASGLLLKSIGPVKNLKNLEKLDVSENELEDISPIAELVYLKELDFSSNVKLEDISPVKNLVTLEKLSMRKVKAGSLESLRSLVNLIYLDCFNTEITTLEPIRNHQKIIHLNVDHNPIPSLEPIRNYRFIVVLSLSTSSVTDLSPIKDFVNLRELDISNTLITTLGPAIKLDYIRELRCQMSKVPKEEVARFKKTHPGANISYWY